MRPVRRWTSAGWNTPSRKRSGHRRPSVPHRRLWRRVYRARISEGLEHCRNCQRVTNDLTFDHLIPVALGGTGVFNNMTLLCPSCNQLKATDVWHELVSLAAEETAAPPERRWFEIAAAELDAHSGPHRKCPVCTQWWRIGDTGLVKHQHQGGWCPGGWNPDTKTKGITDGASSELV